jgi:hypothetical protein
MISEILCPISGTFIPPTNTMFKLVPIVGHSEKFLIANWHLN